MFSLRNLVILIASCIYIPWLGALSPVPLNLPPPPAELDTHHLPIFSVSYAAGKTVGIDENYASLGIFYAPLPCGSPCIPFIDLRAHRMQDNLWAASAGGGIRFWSSNCCYVLGVNAFYDFRAADLGDFHQVGVGFEWLFPHWQFTLNGYLPFKNKFTGPVFFFDDFIGDFFFTCQQSTYAKKGFDFEIGSTFGCEETFQLYFGAGSYYFHAKPGNNIGLKLRTTATIAQYFTIEGIGVYDRSCDLLLQMKVSLVIPLDFFRNFCCHRPDPCCDCSYLFRPVNRSDMIILEDQCCWQGNF